MKKSYLVVLAISLLLFGCLQQPEPQTTPTPGPAPAQTPTPALGSYSAEEDAALAIEEALNISTENLSEIEQELTSGH